MNAVPRWARWLDALTIILAALTAKAVLSESVRFAFAGHVLTVRESWRPALAALAIVAIRHWLLRRPSLWERGVSAWQRWRTEPRATIFRVWAVSRASVLAVGFMASVVIGFPSPDSQRLSRDPILDLPSRFDATWYSGIAREGYSFDPKAGSQVQQTIAFFPAFPIALRLVAPFTEPERHPNMSLRSYQERRASYLLWGGTAISLACFLWALLLLYEWTERRAGAEAARAAVVLIAAYPFAVFYSAAYTESLFLLGTVGACLAFERQRWVPAALLGLLVGLTRPNGCLLSLTLAILALAPLFKSDRTISSATKMLVRVVVAAMPGIGMLMYSAYVYSLADDPLAWMKVQQAWGRNLESTMGYVHWTVRALSEQGVFFWLKAAPLDILQTLAAVFGLAMVWPVWRRLGPAYAVFLLANLLPPLLKGGVLSMGRMTSTLFPMFAALAMAIPPERRDTWVVLFAVGQGFVAVVFFTWRALY